MIKVLTILALVIGLVFLYKGFHKRIKKVKTPEEQLQTDIFNLFKKSGPLDVTQVCECLALEPEELYSAITALQRRKVISLRPDPGAPANLPRALEVWGLG